jgi:hypothetical protein
MKKIALIFILFLLLLTVPIYAAGRILAPKALIELLQKKLPPDVDLKIQSFDTQTDLSILYKNGYIKNDSVSLSFETLILEPRLSLENPLIIRLPSLRVESNKNILKLKNLDIKIHPSFDSIQKFSYQGEIKSLSSRESIIENIVFIVSQLDPSKLKVEIDSDKANMQFSSPLGKGYLKFEDAHILVDIFDHANIKIVAQKVEIDLSKIGYENDSRKLYGDLVELEISTNNESAWEMPINLKVKNARSVVGAISDKLHLKASAKWQERSQNCNFLQILKSGSDCGKLVDILDLVLVLDDEVGTLIFAGDGFCVAPKSGCRQEINASIQSVNTTEIFSNIMRTGLLNPLIGGVMLGGLLSSPSESEAFSDYDHKLKVNVIGSQILLNDEPLIK